MSEVPRQPRHTPGDEVELGALLVLLHGAADSFRTVRATYRTWRHEERLGTAFRADIAEQKRSGASISSISSIYVGGSGDPAPTETEETVDIWRDGQRFREERHGGSRDGYYGVADGPLWWFWDARVGAMSNQEDPSVGSGIGQELEVMLNPTSLLGSLHFRGTGTSQVAGRATITAAAIPRPSDPRHRNLFGELHALGTGAQHYRFEVDRERGVLLSVTAIRDEQPFHQISALAIGFDEPIPSETFHFKPPEGEEIRPNQARHQLQHTTLTEAQQRAPFTVLMPDRIPATWQAHCVFMAAAERPPTPALVSLSYRSDDGHQSISITQMAAADASRHYGGLINGQNWQQVDGDEVSVRVAPAESPHAQAHLERDGTFVFLVSDTLTRDQLVTIAARLRTAPSAANI
ncbi:DUF4245 family protein [Mycobacterium sp. ML4]